MWYKWLTHKGKTIRVEEIKGARILKYPIQQEMTVRIDRKKKKAELGVES